MSTARSGATYMFSILSRDICENTSYMAPLHAVYTQRKSLEKELRSAEFTDEGADKGNI